MRIVLAEPEKGGVAATWSDGTTSFWPAIWLRDQCACPQCRHPSGQRLFEIVDLPEQPQIERIAMQTDGNRPRDVAGRGARLHLPRRVPVRA